MTKRTKSMNINNINELMRRYITESFLPQAGLETFDAP
jgi:hypothetical protein